MNKKPELSELTLREKISQTAMLGQNAVFENFSQSDGAEKYIEENPIGTFHAMGAGNFGEIHMVDGVAQGFNEKDYAKRYHKWMIDLNKVSKIPLLVASDCEGGMGFPFPQMTTVTTAGGLGATDDENLAYKKGYQIAKEATYAGLNWLWGPPADLVGRHMSVMVNRGYGDSVELNQRMVVAEINGMQDAGVAATLKHFPGPGVVEYRDAHASVTINPISVEEWEKTQGAIYQSAIDAGVMSVMIGHSAFPAVDNTKIGNVYIPSTLSEKVIIKLLKEKMGFKGVVVTDGIGMRALALMFDNIDDLHKALIKAGNDVILSVKDIKRYVDMMEKAVLDGEIPMSRIDDACQRVLDMKEKLGLFTDEVQIPKDLPEELTNETKRLNNEIAEKSMTLVCDNGKIPLSKDIKKVIVFVTGYDENVVKSAREVFTREFTARGVNKVEVRQFLDDEKLRYESGDLIPLAEEYDLLIYAPYLPHGWGTEFVGNAFRTMAFSMRYGKEKSIAVSLGSPHLYFDYFQQADTYINLYSPNEESIVAFVKGLYGELPFEGKSQFELIPDFAKAF